MHVSTVISVTGVAIVLFYLTFILTKDGRRLTTEVVID